MINLGLAVMGLALLAAGVVETYLWRVKGWEFMAAQARLRIFLVGRFVGGLVFALGAILFVWGTLAVPARRSWKRWRKRWRKLKLKHSP